MGLVGERSEEDDEEQGGVGLGELSGLDPEADELVYDLDEWAGRDLGLLRQRLKALAVPHEWDGTSLVVAPADEAWVERIMDQVDDELAMSLDEDAEKVGYDLSGWSDTDVADLLARLDDEAVPHDVQDGELLVHEIDEQRVDELVAAATGEGEPDPSAGAVAGEAMGSLFVAADRLVHDPLDHGGLSALRAALQEAAGSGAPYGMDRLWWDGVQAQAGEIVALLDGHDPDPDLVTGRARTLRDGLRPYV